MSAYTDSVAHYLEGLHVSPGACPGCAECHLDTVPCEACGGKGTERGEPYPADDCAACDGAGYVEGSNDDEEARQLAEEPSFSSAQCDGCGSTLAGDRHPAHATARRYLPQERYYGLRPSGPEYILHLDICTDCVLYLANGDEPENWEA